MIFRFVLVAILIVLFPLKGSTQHTLLSVQDALNLAIKNNPELNRMAEEVRFQEAMPGPAWGIGRPELYYLREGVEGGIFMEQRWGISQSVTFPLTGFYQYRKARKDISAAEMRYQFEKIMVRASVKKAYTELAYAIKNVELSESEVQLANGLLEIAQARLEVGESTELDLVQSEIRLNQATNDLRNAVQMKNNARNSLLRVIGIDSENQYYEITFTDTLAYIDTEIDRHSILQWIEESPELKHVRLNSESAKAEVQISKSSYLPDLRIDYYRQDFGNGYDFNGFEVGVSIPLWFGVNEQNRVKQANAAHREALWYEAAVLLSLKEQTVNTWYRYQESRAKILSYREFILERTAYLLELTQEGYRIGELDLLRVLEAQRTYLKGQQDYYQALRSYYLDIIDLEMLLPHEIVFIR
jgi:outer membrane protein, heavy metal efflux system